MQRVSTSVVFSYSLPAVLVAAMYRSNAYTSNLQFS